MLLIPDTHNSVVFKAFPSFLKISQRAYPEVAGRCLCACAQSYPQCADKVSEYLIDRYQIV